MTHGVFDYGDGISAVDAFYDGRADQTAAHILIENGRAAVIDTATAHAAFLRRRSTTWCSRTCTSIMRGAPARSWRVARTRGSQCTRAVRDT